MWIIQIRQYSVTQIARTAQHKPAQKKQNMPIHQAPQQPERTRLLVLPMLLLLLLLLCGYTEGVCPVCGSFEHDLVVGSEQLIVDGPGVASDTTCGELRRRGGYAVGGGCTLLQYWTALQCECTGPPPVVPSFAFEPCLLCGDPTLVIQYPNLMVRATFGQSTCEEMEWSAVNGIIPHDHVFCEEARRDVSERCGCFDNLPTPAPTPATTPPPTPAPTPAPTMEPTTVAPVTLAPVTASPVTDAPVTDAPVTLAPVRTPTVPPVPPSPVPFAFTPPPNTPSSGCSLLEQPCSIQSDCCTGLTCVAQSLCLAITHNQMGENKVGGSGNNGGGGVVVVMGRTRSPTLPPAEPRSRTSNTQTERKFPRGTRRRR